MLDSLLIAAALLVPGNRNTEDRLPPMPMPSVSVVSSSVVMGQREGRIYRPSESVALATRPHVEVVKPHIW